MRFLLSAVGSAGDVHPFIAIGEALVARGHAVRLIASPPFADRVRRAGLDFVPLGDEGEYERVVANADLWHPRRGRRLILEELTAKLADAYAIAEAAATPDAILVSGSLAWGARLLQERRGSRAATIHLSPTLFLSAREPSILPGIGGVGWMPVALRRAFFAFGDRFVIDRLVGPRLDRVREDLGLPRVRRIWTRWMHSPDLVIGAWPAWFAPPQADWPPNTVLGGFALFEEGALDLDPALVAFLDAGEGDDRPIAITPGSAMAHGSDFIARALAAVERIGRRAVIVTPFAEQVPAHRSTSVHHVAYAPFRALLPRVAAMIHHGGIGTSARCLAAGVPQFVVPFAHDQFDNAARLARLGVGATIAADARASRWTRALSTHLASPRTTASLRAIAARMATEPSGAVAIAERLEALGG